MKKTIFGIIALSVLILSVSCDSDVFSFSTEDSEKVINNYEGTRSSSKLNNENGDSHVGIPAYRIYLGKPLRLSAHWQTQKLNQGEVLYVKYVAPTEQEVIVPMKRTYTTSVQCGFILERVLQLTGKYRIIYGRMIDGVFHPIRLEETSNQYLNLETNVIPVKIALGDDYNPHNRSTTYDKYCTAWVAWKVNQMWNVHNKFPSKGNAEDWLNHLKGLGYSANIVPQAGDIAWWQSNHVAFVNEVIDRDHVIITEYNYTTEDPKTNRPRMYNSRHLYRKGGTGQHFPDKFIHVQVPRYK